MHGMIFQQFQQFILTTKDFSMWKDVLKEADLEDMLFLPTQIYPDKYVKDLVDSFGKLTGTSYEEVLNSFGSFLASSLIRIYAYSINPDWKTLDLVEHTENTMHKAVRFNDKMASPPALICTRVSPKRVIIDYSSKRNMVELGVGIIKGIAEHYKEIIQVEVITKANGEQLVTVIKLD